MRPRVAEAVEQSFDRVVADTLRFKQRLCIGEDAYAVLRTKKALCSLWDTVGFGWTGVTVAQSSIVAGTFFAPAAPVGVLGWLGLAAPAVAVTPVGWLVAVGVAASGGYYGVTRLMASGRDHLVDTVPKFINTPIDLLGAGLFDLMAPLAMQVARADGHVHDAERKAIADHFVRDWGLDAAYVAAGLQLIEGSPGSVVALARSLAVLQRDNPDCNPEAMQAELMQFLRDVVEADGAVTPREERALRAIDATFKAEHAPTFRNSKKRVRTAAIAAKAAAASLDSAIERARRSASSLKEPATSGLRNLMLRTRPRDP